MQSPHQIPKSQHEKDNVNYIINNVVMSITIKTMWACPE